MNESDEDVAPIDRGKKVFIENVDERRQCQQQEPVTVKSILYTLTMFTMGLYFADEWFGNPSDFEFKRQIEAVDAEKEPNSIECKVCLDSFLINDMVECVREERHLICRLCFVKMAKTCERTCEIVCTTPNCKRGFNQQVLISCLGKWHCKRLKDKQIEFDEMISLASGVEKVIYCKCGFIGVVETDAKGDSTVACVCGELYCLKCGYFAHPGNLCPEPKSDSESRKWIIENSKPCPNCNNRIEKDGGCNVMSCTRCNNRFCWRCLRRWPGCSCGLYA